MTERPNTSRLTILLIRMAVVFAFGLSGWLAWFSACWLVGRDDVYLRLREVGFGFVSTSAEIFTFVGFIPALFGGFGLGMVAATWLTRGRTIARDGDTRPGAGD